MATPQQEKPAAASKDTSPVIAFYAADVWEHVCPQLRVIRPAKHVGFPLLLGSNWVDGRLKASTDLIEQADLVLITREFPIWASEYQRVMENAHKFGKIVVYELDDLLLELPEQHPDYSYYSAARAAILHAVVEADAVVGSTPQICGYLRQFNPSTHLWENYLDDELWSIAPPDISKQKTLLKIGYMGGHSHIHDLEMITPALLNLAQGFTNQVQIIFWGTPPPERLRDLSNVDWVPVALGGYEEFASFFQLQKPDIFIAPLESNLFNDCKSHLKFLEYSVLGVPGVYSRVKPYERIITHGDNGFLASSVDEWESCLEKLITEPELRCQMGLQAQQTVTQGWLLSDHAYKWADLYQGFSKTEPSTQKDMPAIQIVRKMHDFQRAMEKDLLASHQASKELSSLKSQLIERDQAIFELDKSAQKYLHLYQDLVFSRSWRIMEHLIKLKIRLLPPGSLRERFLAAAYRSLAALRASGIKGFIDRMRSESSLLFKNDQPGTDISVKTTALYQGVIRPGAQLSFPAAAVVCIQDAGASAVDTQSVQEWINNQTLPQAARLICWDKDHDSAYRLDEPAHQWAASTVTQLISGINEKYILIASGDLLQREETYLEANLLALETEGLAFTVNIPEGSQTTLQKLSEGKLPGSSTSPLLRTVVLKKCLGDHFTIHLTAWQAGSAYLSEEMRELLKGKPPTVAGKILTHLTNRADEIADCNFETVTDLPLIRDGLHLLISHDLSNQADRFLLLASPDQLIRNISEPSELPTVMIVMPFLAVGGAEKVALRVMENLADRIRFVVVSYDPHDPALGTTIDLFRSITPYVYQIPEFLSSELNASFTEYLIRRFDPKTIYIANGSPWIYDALPEIKRHHPSIRVANQVYDTQAGWINRYDPALLTYIDAHIGCNPKIARAYEAKGASPESVFFIENGTDPVELDPTQYDNAHKANLKNKFGLPLHTKVVTFASRLNPQKRPLDFVEMARRFPADSGIAFFLVGDGPLAQTVDEQIRKTGKTHIVRRPFYKPITDILAVSDVLVLLSEFEGNPLIVIEAQTMGVPVVATDVGNIRSIIERTHGGVVVSQIGDISALMAGVQKMLDSPPSFEEIRKNTLLHFDWKICAEKHLPAFFGDGYA